MKRIIRPAKTVDASEAIALILMATGSIAYTLSGTDDDTETQSILEAFFAQEDNRLSYRNTLVAEQGGQVVGALVAYHGSDSERLDRPFLERLRALTGQEATIEREAQDDEYYLDSLAVAESHRGQGIARDLIAASEALARELGHDKVALLAEESNLPAYSLYRKLGFERDDIVRIGDYEFHHMVKRIES